MKENVMRCVVAEKLKILINLDEDEQSNWTYLEERFLFPGTFFGSSYRQQNEEFQFYKDKLIVVLVCA